MCFTKWKLFVVDLLTEHCQLGTPTITYFSPFPHSTVRGSERATSTPLSLSLSFNVFGRERSIHLSVFNTRCVVVPFVAQSRPFYVRRSQFARPLYVLSSSHESCTFLHTRVCHMYLWKNFNVYYCLPRRNAIFVSRSVVHCPLKSMLHNQGLVTTQ